MCVLARLFLGKGIMEQNKMQKTKPTVSPVNADELRRKKRKRIWISVACVLCSVVLLLVSVPCVFQIGCWHNQNTLRFWKPNYEREDISALLTKETLTEEEYDLLYRQTGVTKIGIDDMRTSFIGRQKILQIQKNFFRDYVEFRRMFGPFTYTEEIEYKSVSELPIIADLKDGDVLVSTSMYFSWWRFGHSALVVDGAGKRILEALEPGWQSETSSVNTFRYRANFILLRPKVDEEIKAQVVEYAKTELIGLDYSFMVGLLSRKYEEAPTKSQCAHIVWQAYKKFGIDIDSNGGKIVTPHDMYKSEYMEVVQVFGLDLDKLWE